MLHFSDLTFPPGFWEIIDAGKQADESMEKTLQDLSIEEMVTFGLSFQYAVDDLAQQVLEEGNVNDSQDVIEIIAGWVLSQGKDYFAGVFNNPTCFPQLGDSESDLDNQYCHNNYYGMAQTLYEEKFRQPFPDR